MAAIGDPAPKRRKNFTGDVEIPDGEGRSRLVSLDGLNQADATLAADFGYRPVLKRVRPLVTSDKIPEG